MKLRIFPAARADIDAAQDWYNEIQAGLGEDFSDEFQDALQWLLRQPGMGSKRYAHLMADKNLRFWALDRFPFLVFYRCIQTQQGTALEILRVIHERRDITSAWTMH